MGHLQRLRRHDARGGRDGRRSGRVRLATASHGRGQARRALSHSERCAATHCLLHTFPDTPHHRELVKCCLGQKWNELPNWASQRQRSASIVSARGSADVCGGAREEGVHGRRLRVPGLRVPRSRLAPAIARGAARSSSWRCARSTARNGSANSSCAKRLALCARARAERFVVLSCAPAAAGIGSSTAVAACCAARWWRRAHASSDSSCPRQRAAARRASFRRASGCIGLSRRTTRMASRCCG